MPIFALTASRPEIQTRASSSRFLASLRSSPVELARRSPSRLAPVAVVRLVVEDDDVLLVAAELAADAAHHLVGRLGERARVAVGQDRLRQPAGGRALAQQEGVEVGDDDLRLAAGRSSMSGGTMSRSR